MQLQFLRRHQTGRVLAADNIDLHADIRTGMQRLSTPQRIGVKIFSTAVSPCPSCEISFDGANTGCQFNAQCLAGKALQFFAENNGVRTAGFHKFDFLRRETVCHIDQFFIAIFAIKFFLGRVDGQTVPVSTEYFCSKTALPSLFKSGLPSSPIFSPNFSNRHQCRP